MNVPEIIEFAKRNGAVSADDIQGLSGEEIGQIREANAQGLDLPSSYEQFLVHAGRSFGDVGKEFEMCYPEVLEIYTDAYDYSKGVLSILGERDILFGQNIGVSWYWIHAGEPDPPVMGFSERWATLEGKVVESSFSKWLEVLVSKPGVFR